MLCRLLHHDGFTGTVELLVKCYLFSAKPYFTVFFLLYACTTLKSRLTGLKDR